MTAFPARPGSCVPKLSPEALGSRRWHRWAAGDGGDAANCGHGAEARLLSVLWLCLAPCSDALKGCHNLI